MIFWIASAIVTALCVGLFWHALFHVKPTGTFSKRVALLLAMITPLAVLGLYYTQGSIGMPDFPVDHYVSQREQANEKLMLHERPLIRALRANPQDEKTWIDLIALYLQTNRPQQAAQAYQDARATIQKPVLLNNKALRQLDKITD
ncbi:MAG TPA: hypothetical protein VGF14_03400 [Alphaproteobacteria bacterium]